MHAWHIWQKHAVSPNFLTLKCLHAACMCHGTKCYILIIIVHMNVRPDGNALYDTDPDLAALVTAKFTNILEDAIVYRYNYTAYMHVYISADHDGWE